MDSILKKSKELALEVSRSNIFKEYAEAKETMKNLPEIAKRIKDFKLINKEYREKIESGVAVSQEEERNVSFNYHELMRNEEAKKFMICERAAAELVSEVFDNLNDVLKFD